MRRLLKVFIVFVAIGCGSESYALTAVHVLTMNEVAIKDSSSLNKQLIGKQLSYPSSLSTGLIEIVEGDIRRVVSTGSNQVDLRIYSPKRGIFYDTSQVIFMEGISSDCATARATLVPGTTQFHPTPISYLLGVTTVAAALYYHRDKLKRWFTRTPAQPNPVATASTAQVS